jgi:pimeloyl-ACP methyl ester carboxylesterase
VLSESNTVYAIDLLGFGASDKPAGFSYTMETWAEVSPGVCYLRTADHGVLIEQFSRESFPKKLGVVLVPSS